MIEINLLPRELRKNKLELPSLPILPIAGGLLGFLVALSVVLVLAAGFNNRRLAKLSEEKKELLPQIKEVSNLKQELRELNQNTAIIDQLILRNVFWAEKLNRLSDLIISGIWLRRLSLADPKQSLLIEGSVVSPKGEEMVSVGRFMSALKSDELFFKDFQDIELKSIQRRKIEAIEVMDFVLVCYFK